MWGAFAFHAVCMALGMFCLSRAGRVKKAAKGATLQPTG